MQCSVSRALHRGTILLLLIITSLTTGCTKFDILNATVPSCGYQRTVGLSYGSIPRQKLDVYRPRNCAAHANPGSPVVIFFYGGYWTNGEKNDYGFAGEAITREGFVGVVPDYRLYPETTFPGFIEDGAMAVRWVHDHIDQFGGDPNRIYLMGHSAGAHTVALLTLDPVYFKNVGLNQDAIRASIGMSGPYNFVPDQWNAAAFNTTPGVISDPRIEPIHFANGHSKPILLMQGVHDEYIKPKDAQELAAAIQKHGGQAKVLLYPKLGHADMVLAMAWSFRWLGPVMHDVAEFIHQH